MINIGLVIDARGVAAVIVGGICKRLGRLEIYLVVRVIVGA